ncbi:MAG TPA: hypothetical protein VNQ34_11665 [Xanthobacteraceae bacterium]|nr:hypothetical protein [Xanthobacteraceae bacterium]
MSQSTDEDTEEARRLGFREPPVEITRACLIYMARVMEMREVIGFYFNFVKTSQELGKAIPQEAHNTGQTLPPKGLEVLEYNFSKHRQIINEIMLSRAVESFDLYVLNILRLIFESKPELLKSKKSVDVETLIALRTPEEIIYYLAERQINELGYKPLVELRKWILERIGIDLFKNEEIFDVVLLATEVRNLISHNDCRANEILAKRIGERTSMLDISEMGKVRISDEWLRRVAYTLDGVVFDFDVAVCGKFEVYRANRFGTFFLRD